MNKSWLLLQIFLTAVVISLIIFFALLSIPRADAQVIPVLEQFVGTTSPQSSITQRVYGKTIKITGLSTGQCLTLDSNNLLTTVSCGTTLSLPVTVSNGGTGVQTFGQGWIFSSGGTANLSASTSPTLNYFTATSTTATSSIATGGLIVGTNALVVQGATGNVGVGVLNPGANGSSLEVNGTMYASNNVAAGNSFWFPAQLLLMWPTTAINDTGNAYTFANSSGTTFRQIKSSSVYVAAGTAGSKLAGINTDGSGFFSVDVGVATSTPWATLSVSTAAQQSGSLPLFDIGSTTNKDLFNVLGNGHVNIGTSTDAGYALNIAGPSTAATCPGNVCKTLLVDNKSADNVAATQVVINTETSTDGTGTNAPLLIQQRGVTQIYFRQDGAIYSIFNSTLDNSSAALMNSTGNPGSNLAGLDLGSSAFIGWGSGGPWYTSYDTFIGREAAGVVELGTVSAHGAATLAVGKLSVGNGVTIPNATLGVTGTVGIGTTTPWGILSVAPSNTAGSIPPFVVASSTQTAFIVAPNGNVGISTSTPLYPFSVGSSTNTLGPNLYSVDGNASPFFGGQAPLQVACTGGGTCSFDSHATDQAGTVVTGGTVTDVTVTFKTIKAYAPECVTDIGGSGAAGITHYLDNVSSGGFKIVFSASIGTGFVKYWCPMGKP